MIITATEALTLPTAQLTAEELAAIETLETEIDGHIRKSMERRGTGIQTLETRPNVITEVTQRLKNAGYQVTRQGVVEQSQLDPGKQKLVGYQLLIAPTDEAYREAEKSKILP